MNSTISKWSREQCKAQTGELIALYVSRIINVVSMLFLPVLISGLLAGAVEGKGIETGGVLICIFVLAAGVISSFICKVVGENGSARFSKALLFRLWDHNVYADYASYRKRDAETDFQLAVRQSSETGNRYFQTIPLLVYSFVLTIGVFVAAIMLQSPGGAFFIGAVVVLFIIMLIVSMNEMERADTGYISAAGAYHAFLAKLIEDVRFVKLFNFYDTAHRKIEGLIRDLISPFVVRCFWQFLQIGLLRVIQIVLMAFALVQYVNGNMPLAVFLIYEQYIATLHAMISDFASGLRDYRRQNVVVRKMDEMVLPPETCGETHAGEISTVRLDHVTFGYADDKAVFHGFSHTFERGKCYVIKGPNGFGKTTLFDLITGIERPENGAVTINDTDISELALPDLRRHRIAYLTQEDFFRGDSPEDNVSYYLDSTTLKDLQPVFDRLDFRTEEKEGSINETYSGGQKKKLSLAMLMRKAELSSGMLMLFDEPANTLDEAAKKTVCDYLETVKQKAIVLVIAHDTLFDGIADEIIDLSKEEGVG